LTLKTAWTFGCYASKDPFQKPLKGGKEGDCKAESLVHTRSTQGFRLKERLKPWKPEDRSVSGGVPSPPLSSLSGSFV